MKRVLLAPNPFKGTYTSHQAVELLGMSVQRAFPRAQLFKIPLADGGAGTLEVLKSARGGRWHFLRVKGPFGDRVPARWLEWPGRTAVIESAQAVGWAKKGSHPPHPLNASTGGVGELLEGSMKAGMRRFVVTLGDTLTVDGGMGMIEALMKGDFLSARTRLKGLEVWCDVGAPLTGQGGAALGYARQKGASPAQVVRLEREMIVWGQLIDRVAGYPVSKLSGAGAAGGLGAALAGWFGGRLKSGAFEVIKALRVKSMVRRSDLVVTGEGRLDSQSLMGKAPWQVALMAREWNVPCLYVVGRLDLPKRRIPSGIQVIELKKFMKSRP